MVRSRERGEVGEMMSSEDLESAFMSLRLERVMPAYCTSLHVSLHI